MSRSKFAWAPALGVLVLGGPALAQTPPPAAPAAPGPGAGAGLEEVVVTAEERSEDLQKTPLAVTAVGGDSLMDQAITRTRRRLVSLIYPAILLDIQRRSL